MRTLDNTSSAMILPCRCCGDPVNVSKKRYLALIEAGALPVCVRNGCKRLVGPDIRELSHETPVAVVPGLKSAAAVQAEDSQPLASWKLRRCVVSDADDGKR